MSVHLLREATNAIQLRRNFEGSPMLYIPEVYPDYCNETMMVIERIYGVPANNMAALEKQGTKMKLLAERGVQIFLPRFFVIVFPWRYASGQYFFSFEDPENTQHIGIDCSSVGALNKEDKRYLAENFIAFFNCDYRKVAELHVDSDRGLTDTNIEDFEFSIRSVCEPIFEKPLADISFGDVLVNLFNPARRFNMEVQPRQVLLQKTLLYIEGVGRQLYPTLDSWKTAKPFLEDCIKDQVGLPAILRALKEKASYWAEKLLELPELIYDGFKQNCLLQKNIERLTVEIRLSHVRQSQSRFLFCIGATQLLIGTFLMTQSADEGVWPFWLIAAGIVIWIIGWRRTAQPSVEL